MVVVDGLLLCNCWRQDDEEDVTTISSAKPEEGQVSCSKPTSSYMTSSPSSLLLLFMAYCLVPSSDHVYYCRS